VIDLLSLLDEYELGTAETHIINLRKKLADQRQAKLVNGSFYNLRVARRMQKSSGPRVKPQGVQQSVEQQKQGLTLHTPKPVLAKPETRPDLRPGCPSPKDETKSYSVVAVFGSTSEEKIPSWADRVENASSSDDEGSAFLPAPGRKRARKLAAAELRLSKLKAYTEAVQKGVDPSSEVQQLEDFVPHKQNVKARYLRGDYFEVMKSLPSEIGAPMRERRPLTEEEKKLLLLGQRYLDREAVKGTKIPESGLAGSVENPSALGGHLSLGIQENRRRLPPGSAWKNEPRSGSQLS